MKAKLTLLFLCLSLTCVASAQSLTNVERRKMNSDLLVLLKSFEEFSSFSEDYMKKTYVSLFSSSEVLVYCDYPSSLFYGKAIPVSKYAAFSSDELVSIESELSNVKKTDYEFIGSNWTTNLKMHKKISYQDNLGVTFSGEADITLCCAYNKDSENFYITSIKGTDSSGETERPWYLFPGQRFSVIQKLQPQDESVCADGSTLSFNDYDLAFISGSTFVFNDNDVVMKSIVVGETEAYSLYNFSYKTKRARFRIHADFAPVSAFSISSPVDFTSKKSSAYGFGVDVGYMWTLGAKFKMGVYGGIGMTMSKIGLEVDNVSFSVPLSKIDPSSDGFIDYNRCYSIDKASESMDFTDVVIPLYLSTETNLSKRVSLLIEVGPKLNLNTKMKVTPYSLSGKVFDKYVGFDDQSSAISTENGYMSPTSYRRKAYDVSVLGRIGADVSVYGMHSLFFRVGYEYGLTETYSSDKSQWLSTNDGIVPIFFSNGRDIMIRSFAECISYKRNALWLDFGYKLKF